MVSLIVEQENSFKPKITTKNQSGIFKNKS